MIISTLISLRNESYSMGGAERKRSIAEVFDSVPRGGMLLVRVRDTTSFENEAYKRNNAADGEVWSLVTLVDRGLLYAVIQRRERWAETPDRILAAEWRIFAKEQLSHWAR